MAGPTPLASPAAATALLAGALLASPLPALPPVPVLVALLGFAALLCWRGQHMLRLLGVLAVGFGGFALHGAASVAGRLPTAFEGRDLAVVGRVVDLPRENGGDRGGVRFGLQPESAQAGDQPVPVAGLWRLASYSPDFEVAPGERLTLTVRMRRPRGGVNPGGYDGERFAAERRITATGYVRAVRSREPARWISVDGLRHRFGVWLAARSGVGAAGEGDAMVPLLRALAVGDQGALRESHWSVLRATGIAHLVAISGFHIGLVAGFGALLARVLWRLVPLLAARLARPRAEAIAALGLAAAYGALAGASLPVLRTLAAIAVVAIAVLLRRAPGLLGSLALALIALLLADPLALLGAGFWLSFAGVAWLIYCLGGRVPRAPLVAGFVRAQWALSLALIPLTLLFFQQTALAGPLANAVAVPWISLVVVPLLLLTLALWLIAPAAAGIVADAAGSALALLWEPLTMLAAQPWAEWRQAAPDTAAFALATLGLAVLLLPRAVPGRALGVILLLPTLFPGAERPPHGAFDLHVLDVGQGQAVLVRTANHALLADAGAAGVGFDHGEASVVPSALALGVRRLDLLLVTHGDLDHAGGVWAVVRALRPDRVLGTAPALPAAHPCEAGTSWIWDGVPFRLLHPPRDFPDLGNDSSCVLQIGSGERAALLPGDIGAVVEARLVRLFGEGLRAGVLLAPHHGSRSSSSAELLDAVRPGLVAISAGHRNRFGHPATEVLGRYRERRAAPVSTADEGALSLTWRDGAWRWEGRRRLEPRWWREAAG